MGIGPTFHGILYPLCLPSCWLTVRQSFRKVFISSLKDLVVHEDAGLFKLSLHGKPICKVEIIGLITSLERRAKKILLTVDDGTGSVRCIKFIDDLANYDTSSLSIGTLVVVRGSLELSETNRSSHGPAVTVALLEPAAGDDPNMETLHWLRTMQLMKDVYSKPFG